MLTLSKFEPRATASTDHLDVEYEFKLFEKIPELLKTVRRSFGGPEGLNFLE
jgi:hypothetical protein